MCNECEDVTIRNPLALNDDALGEIENMDNQADGFKSKDEAFVLGEDFPL